MRHHECVRGRKSAGAGFLHLLGESTEPPDRSVEGGTLERPIARRSVTAALLAVAGAILVLTSAQGLVTVLVLIAACATATWSGRWAGAGLAAVAGAVFITVNVLMDRTHDIGVLLTFVAVCMWVFLAWAAGVTAEERRRMNELLVHRALHDPLTGLANRRLLMNRLDQAIRRGKRNDTRVAVIFVDLDGFKRVNDSMGHAAGDALLIELGERFVQRLRDSDTAGRLGGDEFAFACEDLHDEHEATHIAERLVGACAEPFRHQGQEVPIRASVGIAVESAVATDAEQLLRQADEAMYRAKHGKGLPSAADPRRVEFHHPRDPRADRREPTTSRKPLP
jgi:diguanylate cyclase (GGDEF)-like protein